MKYEKVYDETFYFPAALTYFEQKSLVKIYRKIQDTLYIPKLKSGHSMNLKMTCLGLHWSAKDYHYHNVRKDVDDQPVLPFNPTLTKLTDRFLRASFPNYSHGLDVAICNYYTLSSTLGLHKDNSESKESLNRGDPIVSFSVGASCDFQMGGLNRYDPLKTIKLNSGDVLVFGGSDRLRYHGVNKIHQLDAPFQKFLNYGRINLTLRKL
jgi:DNA alkylation damage repair protein AlkB